MSTSTIVLSGSSVRLTRVCASLVLLTSFTAPAIAADGVKKSDVTYTKDVSRIVEERCQTCHHKGTAAPFSLLTYEDAKNKANRIREAVTANRMPPWHADPNHGKFSN